MFPTEGYEQFECLLCRAVVEVRIIAEPDKATYPTIEFCPCCGLSLVYLSPSPLESVQDETRKMNQESMGGQGQGAPGIPQIKIRPDGPEEG